MRKTKQINIVVAAFVTIKYTKVRFLSRVSERFSVALIVRAGAVYGDFISNFIFVSHVGRRN
jgi:hypothetical protein